MALKINFNGMEIKFPSWSGPKKCDKCGGRGYSTGGMMPNGKPGFSTVCMEDPKHGESQNWPGKKTVDETDPI